MDDTSKSDTAADKIVASKVYTTLDKSQDKEEEHVEGSEEEAVAPAKEEPARLPEYIILHTSGGQWIVEQIAEVKNYAKVLNYQSSALVYDRNDEDDYSYCD